MIMNSPSSDFKCLFCISLYLVLRTLKDAVNKELREAKTEIGDLKLQVRNFFIIFKTGWIFKIADNIGRDNNRVTTGAGKAGK